MTRFAASDGARVAYDTTGEGPDILLIHAGVTDRHMWDEVVPLLSSDFRVTRYDMRGFGETEEVEESEWAPRRDLIAVMDAAGIEQAAVVGVSMGGGTAINAVLENPNRFTALAAVNPGLGGFDYQPDEWEDAIEDRINEAYKAEQWNELADLEMDMWLAGPHRTVKDMDRDVVDRMRTWLLASYAKPSPWSRAMKMDDPANDRLGEISIPTLAILGELDVASMGGVVERIAAAVPDGSKVTMSTAHLPPLEQPAEFAAILRDFLTGS